jgi:hypothetical protein
MMCGVGEAGGLRALNCGLGWSGGTVWRAVDIELSSATMAAGRN